MSSPLARLQQLAQTYNLVPTIAVLQQNGQGVQISIEMDISQFEKKPAGTTRQNLCALTNHFIEARSFCGRPLMAKTKKQPK